MISLFSSLCLIHKLHYTSSSKLFAIRKVVISSLLLALKLRHLLILPNLPLYVFGLQFFRDHRLGRLLFARLLFLSLSFFVENLPTLLAVPISDGESVEQIGIGGKEESSTSPLDCLDSSIYVCDLSFVAHLRY